MNIIKRIKAIFKYQNQDAELEVAEAIIKPGKVILRPTDNPTRMVTMKAHTVDIIINRNQDIREEDVEIMDPILPVSPDAEEPQEDIKEDIKKETSTKERHTPATNPSGNFITKKKIVSFALYPDEYEMLMENIRSNGYKKAEFLLACVVSAKKNSLEANYQKYAETHKERRAAERLAAKQAQQQEQIDQLS